MNVHAPKVLTHPHIYMIMDYIMAFPTKEETPILFLFILQKPHFFFKTTHRPMFLAEFLDEAQLHPARCSPAPVPVSPSNQWPKSPATWPGPVTAFHRGIKLNPPKGWVAMILCDMLCELKWFSLYFPCIFHVFSMYFPYWPMPVEAKWMIHDFLNRHWPWWSFLFRGKWQSLR